MLFSSCNFTINTLKGILVKVTIFVFSVLASLNSIEPACGCGELGNGDGIEQAATRFLEVDNEFHITRSASAAAHSGVIPGIIQTNPIQFFDFVSDLFDFRSKFLHHLPVQRGCSS